MKKIKLGVIFGGMSTENEVSVTSAGYILESLDRNKYEIFPIYIAKDGIWYKCKEEGAEQWSACKQTKNLGEDVPKEEKITNIMEYLQQLDILFPVLHGLYGEDGTIQGLFELLKKPYVGCKVLASSVSMDKAYTKIIFEKAGLNQAKYEYIKKHGDKYTLINENFDEQELSLEQIVEKLIKTLPFPMFIKPSNFGSSVGIGKAKNKQELANAITEAAKYDSKILIEEGINGKELECAILKEKEVMASGVGEIKSAEEFYTYDAKYKNEASRTEIPANLPENITNEIRKQAIKAFKAIDGSGLARVDFFLQDGTNKIYINEINTLPGFTSISMYPKLWEESGIPAKDLLDKLVNSALLK